MNPPVMPYHHASACMSSFHAPIPSSMSLRLTIAGHPLIHPPPSQTCITRHMSCRNPCPNVLPGNCPAALPMSGPPPCPHAPLACPAGLSVCPRLLAHACPLSCHVLPLSLGCCQMPAIWPCHHVLPGMPLQSKDSYRRFISFGSTSRFVYFIEYIIYTK